MQVVRRSGSTITVDLDHIVLTYDLNSLASYLLMTQLCTKLDCFINTDRQYAASTIELPWSNMRINSLVITKENNRLFSSLHSKQLVDLTGTNSGVFIYNPVLLDIENVKEFITDLNHHMTEFIASGQTPL
jgi:hypothetical protein